MRHLVHHVKLCWNCGRLAGDSLFCRACHALQPPPADYYDLLGLERKLALSRQTLQDRFYELSRQLHPDRFMRKPERERQYSLDASSALNDAYRILRDPVQRAAYILKLQGIDMGEQRSQNVPPELLEEVFELNLALEEMRGGDRSARPQLEEASRSFHGMLAQVDGELEALFVLYDAAPKAETLAQIRGVLNRRKYILNLVNEVTGVLAA